MTAKLKRKRSQCPISCWLDFFGDKWTLVVVRDLFAGKTRYGDFQGSPEGIPTNILADRLKKLEEVGVVKKRLYSKHSLRYEYALTSRGCALLPVLQEMARWSSANVSQTWEPPDWFWEGRPEDFEQGRNLS